MPLSKRQVFLWCTSTTILLACVTLVSSSSQLSLLTLEQQPPPPLAPWRRLQEEEEEAEEEAEEPTNALVNEKNRKQANAIGAEVRESIRSFRGGSPEFYDRLLKSLLVIMCDQKIKSSNSNDNDADGQQHSPALRFVRPEDPTALTNITTGECLRVKQPEDEVKRAYDQGLCEVKSTCYWAPVNTSESFRYPTYDLDKSKWGTLQAGALTLSEAEAEVEEWATGLAKLIAPGIILAVLTFLSLVLFLFCRCCCDQCGGRRPNKNGYRWTKKLLPIVIHVVFSVGIVAMLAMSQIFNAEIMTSIGKVFDITKDTLGESKDWIVTARQPLIEVRDQVFVTVDQVKVELEGTDFIEVGLNGITSRVEAFGNSTANVTMPRGCTPETSVFCYPCGVCTTIDERVGVVVVLNIW